MANDNKDLNDFFKKYEKEEPEELKQYIEDINQGVDPNKTTTMDKLAGFFRNLAIRTGLYYKKEKKTEISEKPSDFIRKMRIFYKRNIKKLSDRFNFEAGVDVLDDVQVLYKRNKVNRNILLITNVVLILFTFIGNQDPNALVIIIFGIIMFIVSISMKNIVSEGQIANIVSEFDYKTIHEKSNSSIIKSMWGKLFAQVQQQGTHER